MESELVNSSIYNVTKFCESKLTDFELDTDPDINFFNNLIIPSSNYYDLENLSTYFSDLNYINPFNLMHINCRSLYNKINEIKLLTNMFKLNVLAMTETWLEEEIANLILIPEYTLIHKSRNSSKRGGGVGFLVSNEINYQTIDLEIPEISTFEFQVIKILTAKSQHIFLICIYRPPGTPIDAFITELEILLNNKALSKRVIITGDLNINLLKASAHEPSGNFFNCMMANRYIPLINKPTRVTSETSTLIDNFFVNFYSNKLNTAILQYPISDHYPILLSLDLKIDKITFSNPINVRKINSTNKLQFLEKIKTTEWSEVKQACLDNNTAQAYTNFLKIFKSQYDESFPIINPNTRKKYKKPWMTPAIMKSVKTKTKLYRNYLNNPTIGNKSIFNKFNNQFKVIMKQAEKDFNSTRIQESLNSSAKLWKQINNLLNKNKKSNSVIVLEPPMLERDNLNVTSTANRFNNFFVNVGSVVADSIQPLSNTNQEVNTLIDNPNKCSFQIYPTTPEEIRDIIVNLKHKNSQGHDEINQNIVIACAEHIAEPLSDIINSSFLTGVIPHETKIAKITPIYKSGLKTSEANYRPISNLTVFSKILEKAMHSRIINYLSKFNMLSNCQFGFRPGFSTAMPIINLIDSVTTDMEEHKHVIGIFLDVKKAFDSLDHDILLNKLSYYGFRGKSIDWLTNFLKNRSQYTIINNEISDLKEIKYGVPQGSILGPLLFLIYINDLPNATNLFKYFLFADDTSLTITHTNISELIRLANEGLIKIANWFNVNKLALNLEKTHYVHFHTNKTPLGDNLESIQINETVIVHKPIIKFLGIYLDQHLDWKYFYKELANKLAKNLNIIRHLKYYLDHKALQQLYFALIHSYLSYCTIVWGNNYKTNLRNIQTIQNKSIRLVFRECNYLDTDSLYNKYKILNISSLFKMQTLLFVYKHINNLLPLYYSSNKLFHKNPECKCNLRNSNNLFIPFAATNKRKFTTKFIGPRLWNDLPLDLKLISHWHHFKKALKSYLITIQHQLGQL